MDFIKENLKLIIAALIALLLIAFGAVALSLAFGGETVRALTVTDIQGTAVVIRGSKQLQIGKKTVLQSGDIVNTAENSTVRICIDKDKYIAVEPETSVYVYYTQISGKGDVSVNIACGAVTAQLNEPLKKNETFVVKTPNTAVNVRGTVFRTEFSLKEKYMGYNDVMITHVQNFDGSVMLQLYDTNSEKSGEPMLLTERTSAELISCEGVAQYGYLNYDTDMYALNELTLMELIRVSGEHPIAYTLDEIDSALRAAKRRKTETTPTAAETTTEETTSVSSTKTETTTTTTASSSETETETEESSFNTLATTLQTYIYTTYAGPKWWEMPNEHPDEDDFYYDDGGVNDPQTQVVTTVPILE